MSKINDVINSIKMNELFHKNEEEEKKKNRVLQILAIVGIVTVIAGIAYGVFKFVSSKRYNEDEIDYDEDYLFDDLDD